MVSGFAHLHGASMRAKIAVMAEMELYSEKNDVVYLTQNRDPFFDYLTRKIFAHVDFSKKDARLLDLGCGSGRVVFDAAAKGMSGMGVDYIPKAIKIANQTAKRLNLDKKVKFIRGNLLRAKPRQYGMYDYVVMMEVIEHVDDYQKLVNLAWSSLKKGGKLLLTTPNNPLYWTILDDYAHHVRRFTIPQVKNSLERFSKVKIGTIGYPLHIFFEKLYSLMRTGVKKGHNPKLFRANPFITRLYYVIGSAVMWFDDHFKTDKGTTIVAIATK